MPNDQDETTAKNDGADLRRANSLAFDAAKAFVRDDRTPLSTKLTAGTPGFLTALHDAILGAVLRYRSAPTYEQGVAAGLEMAAKVVERTYPLDGDEEPVPPALDNLITMIVRAKARQIRALAPAEDNKAQSGPGAAGKVNP